MNLGVAARDARTAGYAHGAPLSLGKKRSSTRLERTSPSTDVS